MSEVSQTSRVLVLVMHALRRSAGVASQVDTLDWLAADDAAEAELLRRAGGIERHLLPLMSLKPLRRLLLAWIDRRVPATSRHLLWRKLWFHRRACRFLAEPGQLLCLGSGLDPLGFRLARRFPDSQIVEVDRPSVMELKQDWLASTGIELRNLRLVGADLAGPNLAPRTLGLDPERRSLVLAEGLLMYLRPIDVEALFASLPGWFTGSLELAFSCLDADRLRERGSSIARLDAALRKRARGESFRWSMKLATTSTWLAGLGFDLNGTEGSSPDIGTQYGEFVATASRQAAPANRMAACPAMSSGASRPVSLSS